MTDPDERADYHGFGDVFTENLCGREDFEPRAEARHIRMVAVPWTIIKEIMAAISARAALEGKW